MAIKKFFKKVTKFVKKIAPVLIVAAAVYFGGAYLMASAGTAGASAGASVTYAAGGVGEAFTKSAGVWKSFLGGLSTGTASQSAVAFAEGSFKASKVGMSLSGQVAAGTSAVNMLSTGVSTGEAVKQGFALADAAFKSGGDVQSSWDILWNGLNDVTAPVGEAVGEVAGQGVEMSVSGGSPTEGLFSSPVSPEQAATLDAQMYDSSQWMADNTMSNAGEMTTGSSVSGATLNDSANSNPWGIISETAPPVTEVAEVATPQTSSFQSQMLEWMKANQASQDKILQSQIDLAREEMIARASVDKWKLGMTAGGLFLNAFGQYQQANAAEKERKNQFRLSPENRALITEPFTYTP